MLTRRKAIKATALATVSAAMDTCLPKLSAQPTFHVIRESRPRLYHPADDPAYTFGLPKDPARKAILQNLVADCEELSNREPWKGIPESLDSPHPYHQLYITFYSGMQASALIEQYAFAWRMTHDKRWLTKAKQWLLAAASWEHSDRIEESFYTANRYMHAFAVALDWLADGLTTDEEESVVKTLVQMMNRWWPEVDKNRHNANGGHHAVVDNGHFGVAALQLLGRHPDASEWVSAVIDRFRAGIMPNGCGKDGEPTDGIYFWYAENTWMLHFCDALRNVVGVDLYREFPERVTKPLNWIRYCLAPPKQLSRDRCARANSSSLTGIAFDQLDACSPVLLRLAQEAGDEELRDIALRDPLLGRVHLTGMGVKNSDSELMMSFGPYAYLYFDPSFRPVERQVSYPFAKTFTDTSYGTVVFLRSSWAQEALVAQILGYDGGVAHSYSNLHVQWAGYPVVKTIGAVEASPVTCGSLPCIGGQNEVVARVGALESTPIGDKINVEAARTSHEYWVLRGQRPALLIALRRKPRGAKVVKGEDGAYVRLDGQDFLQYPREPFLNPDAGELRLKVRLQDAVDPKRPQIFFSVGIGVPQTGLGPGVNLFSLGFFATEGLSFAVTSQRSLTQRVNISPKQATMLPGQWHEVTARWGGFNDPSGNPFIELELDGQKRRFDDPAAFGEVGVDTQRLKSRTTPRTFYVKPNTALAFGAAMQIPGTGVACDIAQIHLNCPQRQPLDLGFEHGLVNESGSDALQWKINPVQLLQRGDQNAIFGAGAGRVRLMVLEPASATLKEELVPFSPGGYAASSLRNYNEGAEDPSTRLLVTAKGDHLILMFLDQEMKTQVSRLSNGLQLTLDDSTHNFEFSRQGASILKHRA